MKAFKYLFFVALMGVLFYACTEADLFQSTMEENSKPGVELVPFKGKFQSVPAGYDMVTCLDPVYGVEVQAVYENIVSGNATHLGVLDEVESKLYVLNCELNLTEELLIGTLEMTFKNKKGDGIKVLGVSRMGLYGKPSSGEYSVSEGYGKFEGATGQLSSSGLVNFETGVADFKMDGLITKPHTHKK
ncbi:MAG: hypothetical protein HKN68_02080 [Saprospiraceae bacterium]|nr:hypothetical protein [Saprospiraceae bacterium]